MNGLYRLSVGCAALLAVAGSANAEEIRFIAERMIDIREFPNPGGHWHTSPNSGGGTEALLNRVARQPVEEVWNIPAGSYGLRLQDGTKMIGRPAKGWSVKLQTSFGPVDIPLEQVARLAPTKDGRLTAHFMNGDRVSGVAMAQTFKYETSYGVLTIRCSDIERMDSSKSIVAAKTGSPGGPTPPGLNPGKQPPRPPVVESGGDEEGAADSSEGAPKE